MPLAQHDITEHRPSLDKKKMKMKDDAPEARYNLKNQQAGAWQQKAQDGESRMKIKDKNAQYEYGIKAKA
jgi:hypothetical protein